MNRRNWIAELAAAIVAIALWPRRLLVGEEPKQQASLEDRLNSGLQCRRPEEFGFVATVTQRVRTGQRLRVDGAAGTVTVRG